MHFILRFLIAFVSFLAAQIAIDAEKRAEEEILKRFKEKS